MRCKLINAGWIEVFFAIAASIYILLPSTAMAQGDAAAVKVDPTAPQDDTTDPDSMPGQSKSAPELMPGQQQKIRVNEIYQLTKTAGTAKELTLMIEECDAAIKAGLAKKRSAYVRKLKAWALSRRGDKRTAVARQLKLVGNIAQYKRALTQAMVDFDDSLTIDTARHQTFNSRGIAQLLDQQWLLAVQDFTKAIGLKADYAAGYFNRAETLSVMKKFDLAIKDYDTVLSLLPGDAQALSGRALANTQLENYQLALADYGRVIQTLPNNATVFINRGDCHQREGKWNSALDDYAAAKKQGDSKTADQRTAWVLATAGDEKIRDPQRALSLIEPCLQTSSDPSIAMLETLAAAQAAVGRFEDAQKNQDQAIQLTGGTTADDRPTADASQTPPQLRLALYVNQQAFVQPTHDKLAKEAVEQLGQLGEKK